MDDLTADFIEHLAVVARLPAGRRKENRTHCVMDSEIGLAGHPRVRLLDELVLDVALKRSSVGPRPAQRPLDLLVGSGSMAALLDPVELERLVATHPRLDAFDEGRGEAIPTRDDPGEIRQVV